MTPTDYYRWLLSQYDAYAEVTRNPHHDQATTIRYAGARDAYKDAAAKMLTDCPFLTNDR